VIASTLGRLKLYAELVAFHHTIFALPFAFMGMILAAGGSPRWRQASLVTLAMVGARTAAMAFNRIVDERFDKLNPRTAGRPLPSGRMKRTWALGLLVLAVSIFVTAAALLNRLCLLLSPVALAIVLTYSLTKRFTFLTHFHLGASLGIAPIAAWIAVTGKPAWPPILLGIAVLLWTAGFDIIYASQDVDFDRHAGLHSLPARFGIAASLRVSSALHVLMFASLLALPATMDLGWAYRIGVLAVAGILVFEHSIVRPDDLSRVNAAFFAANGWISVGLLAATAIDLASR
jgi:4-hydroxybenzoate polyprenyltransferase